MTTKRESECISKNIVYLCETPEDKETGRGSLKQHHHDDEKENNDDDANGDDDGSSSSEGNSSQLHPESSDPVSSDPDDGISTNEAQQLSMQISGETNKEPIPEEASSERHILGVDVRSCTQNGDSISESIAHQLHVRKEFVDMLETNHESTALVAQSLDEDETSRHVSSITEGVAPSTSSTADSDDQQQGVTEKPREIVWSWLSRFLGVRRREPSAAGVETIDLIISFLIARGEDEERFLSEKDDILQRIKDADPPLHHLCHAEVVKSPADVKKAIRYFFRSERPSSAYRMLFLFLGHGNTSGNSSTSPVFCLQSGGYCVLEYIKLIWNEILGVGNSLLVQCDIPLSQCYGYLVRNSLVDYSQRCGYLVRSNSKELELNCQKSGKRLVVHYLSSDQQPETESTEKNIKGKFHNNQLKNFMEGEYICQLQKEKSDRDCEKIGVECITNNVAVTDVGSMEQTSVCELRKGKCDEEAKTLVDDPDVEPVNPSSESHY